MPDRAPNPRDLNYLALTQVGLEMVAPVALGLVLDYVLGWSPWATVSGAVLGFGGGMWHLIRLVSPRDRADSSGHEREQP